MAHFSPIEKKQLELKTLEDDFNNYIAATDGSVFKHIHHQKNLFFMKAIIGKFLASHIRSPNLRFSLTSSPTSYSIISNVYAQLRLQPITTFANKQNYTNFSRDEDYHLRNVERLINSLPLIPFINTHYPYNTDIELADLFAFDGEPYINILTDFADYLKTEQRNLRYRKNIILTSPIFTAPLSSAPLTPNIPRTSNLLLSQVKPKEPPILKTTNPSLLDTLFNKSSIPFHQANTFPTKSAPTPDPPIDKSVLRFKVHDIKTGLDTLEKQVVLPLNNESVNIDDSLKTKSEASYLVRAKNLQVSQASDFSLSDEPPFKILDNTEVSLSQAVKATTSFMCSYFYYVEGPKRICASLKQVGGILTDLYRRLEISGIVNAEFYSISKIEVYNRLIFFLSFLVQEKFYCVIGIHNIENLKGCLSLFQEMKDEAKKQQVIYGV